MGCLSPNTTHSFLLTGPIPPHPPTSRSLPCSCSSSRSSHPMFPVLPWHCEHTTSVKSFLVPLWSGVYEPVSPPNGELVQGRGSVYVSAGHRVSLLKAPAFPINDLCQTVTFQVPIQTDFFWEVTVSSSFPQLSAPPYSSLWPMSRFVLLLLPGPVTYLVFPHTDHQRAF